MDNIKIKNKISLLNRMTKSILERIEITKSSLESVINNHGNTEDIFILTANYYQMIIDELELLLNISNDITESEYYSKYSNPESVEAMQITKEYFIETIDSTKKNLKDHKANKPKKRPKTTRSVLRTSGLK